MNIRWILQNNWRDSHASEIRSTSTSSRGESRPGEEAVVAGKGGATGTFNYDGWEKSKWRQWEWRAAKDGLVQTTV